MCVAGVIGNTAYLSQRGSIVSRDHDSGLAFSNFCASSVAEDDFSAFEERQWQPNLVEECIVDAAWTTVFAVESEADIWIGNRR
jgi:hypothetical protein